MAGTITINGIDLRTLEFYHEHVPGALDGPEQTVREINIPGTDGVFFSGPTKTGARELTIQGTLLPATATIGNIDLAMKKLLGWVRTGLLRIVITSGAGQVLVVEGTYQSCIITPKSDDRPLDRVAADVTLKIRCRGAYWRQQEPTITHLTAAATRFEIRQRSGACTLILWAFGTAGLTNPTWTIRRPDGSILKQLVLASLNLAAADGCKSDSRNGRTIVYRSGVPSYVDSNWTGDFPMAADHRECYPDLGQYLTAEISAGTGRIIHWETDS